MRRKPAHQEPQVYCSQTNINDTVFENYDIATEDKHVEESGFMLVCAVDSCDCEKAFEDLDGIRKSSWTQLDFPGIPLTNGLVLHESYCPDHSFPELDNREDDIVSDEFNPPNRWNGGGVR